MSDIAPPTDTGHGASHSATRRDFLFIATGSAAVVGTATVLWPLIDQMNPDAATIAAAEPIDVDLTTVATGQQVLVLWRGHPIFIVNRTPAALATLQNPALIAQLSDPDSTVMQQPDYANNWHRSVKPEYLVLVGVCTHLGCIPTYTPEPGSNGPDWLGGYFCHCHGSKYDLAGRVFRGVPAPYNLPVPPYRFTSDTIVRIGDNPSGESYDLDSIVQL